MVGLDRARLLALSLPEAAEQDHHGRASWRVRGKIFATLPDEAHVNVMLEPDDIREAVLVDPIACAEVYWGQKLSALCVSLVEVEEDVLLALLTDAWRRRAPKALGASLPHASAP